MNSTPLLLSQICATYMCGVIWIIQLIHYPSFKFINPVHFAEAHQRHTGLMGLIVGPVMIVELLAGLWLISERVNYFSVANLTIIALLWILTFFVSVPLHNKLSGGFHAGTIKDLVMTNWPRTILWSLKVGLTSYWMITGSKT